MTSSIIPATVTSDGFYVLEPATTTLSDDVTDDVTINTGGLKIGFDLSEAEKKKAQSMISAIMDLPDDFTEIDKTHTYANSDYNMIADTREEFIKMFGRTPLSGVYIHDQGRPTGPRNILFYEGSGCTVTILDFTKTPITDESTTTILRQATAKPNPEKNFFGIKIFDVSMLNYVMHIASEFLHAKIILIYVNAWSIASKKS